MHKLEKEMLENFHKHKDYFNPRSNSVIFDINNKISKSINNHFTLNNTPIQYIKTHFNLNIPQKSINDIYQNIEQIDTIDDLNKLQINQYTIDEIIKIIKPKIELMMKQYNTFYDKEKLELKYKDSKIVSENWNILVIKNNKIIDKLNFSKIDNSDWEFISNNLHYIWNARKDTLLHLWLTDSENNIIAYSSFSTLDREYPLSVFKKWIKKEEIINMTRAFSINRAPSNLMSMLYHKAYKFIKNNFPEKKYLMTYINQNLLFEWSSFKWASYFPKWLSPMQYIYVNWIYRNRKNVKESEVFEKNKLEVLPIILLARWLTKNNNKELEFWNKEVVEIDKIEYLKW